MNITDAIEKVIINPSPDAGSDNPDGDNPDTDTSDIIHNEDGKLFVKINDGHKVVTAITPDNYMSFSAPQLSNYGKAVTVWVVGRACGTATGMGSPPVMTYGGTTLFSSDPQLSQL